MLWKKVVKLVRKLLFDSAWDYLKAGVLVGLFFLWGNFLGWYYEPPRSLKIERLYMGDFFEGYGFINLAFVDFESDTDNKVPLLFDPTALRDMRVCEDLYWKDTGRGMKYLRRIVDKYSQCIKLEADTSRSTTRVTISKIDNSNILKPVDREGSKHWFCGCEQKVLDTFARDADYP